LSLLWRRRCLLLVVLLVLPNDCHLGGAQLLPLLLWWQ
jgi:hypothetical protein